MYLCGFKENFHLNQHAVPLLNNIWCAVICRKLVFRVKHFLFLTGWICTAISHTGSQRSKCKDTCTFSCYILMPLKIEDRKRNNSWHVSQHKLIIKLTFLFSSDLSYEDSLILTLLFWKNLSQVGFSSFQAGKLEDVLAFKIPGMLHIQWTLSRPNTFRPALAVFIRDPP